MPKILIGVSILLLTLSALFGFLNTSKVTSLRDELATTRSAQETADRARLATEKKLKTHDTTITATSSKISAAEAKASSSEAALAKAQNEKAELQARLEASATRIAALEKGIAGPTVVGVSGTPEGASPNELQAQLDETRRQLDAAEQEKAVLADKMRSTQDHVAVLEEDKKRRDVAAKSAALHGTVLAVNQAYNFVVLSMGDRQGVVPDSEMLVLRQGALIGKIRISSVEPTTSIGDIITSSLARGVQVQPGDTVVYAGTTNS